MAKKLFDSFGPGGFSAMGVTCKTPNNPKAYENVGPCPRGIWNATQVGSALGLNHKTINNYLDFFENAFLIRRLRPFHANIGKRLIKSPKVYWRDTGLLHSLLNITRFQDLISHPNAGMSWEGFVIEQIITTLSYTDHFFEPFFFRTSDGRELDLLIDFGHGEKWGIEIKLTTNPSPQDLKRLEKTCDLIQADKRVLISQIKQSTGNQDVLSYNLEEILKYFENYSR